MSNGAMLGLLEGIGQGLNKTGDMMAKNELAAAEDARRMNLERVRREWANQDYARGVAAEQTQHERNRGETLADQDTSIVNEAAQHARNRGETVADQDKSITTEAAQHSRNRSETVSDQGVALSNQKSIIDYNRDNPVLSEMDKTIIRADEALAAGKITEKDYRQITLGLGKTEGMTGQQAATLRMSALKQASVEVIGKDPMKPATPEQTKAISARAGEIFDQSLGTTKQQTSAIPGSTTIIDGKTYKVNPDGKTMSQVTQSTITQGNKPALSPEDQAWNADAAVRDENDQIQQKAIAARKRQDAMSQDISNFGAGNGLLEKY